MVQSNWREVNPNTIFGNSRFYKWLKTIFADRIHTHAISDVTNLQSLLSGKQDIIPSLTQKTSQSMYGATVKTYSDGLYVYLTIETPNGLNGDSALPVGGSIGNLGTLSDTAYAPFVAMQSPVHTANNNSKVILGSDGTIRLLNGTSSKTMSFSCSFYYPLKSRFPSGE